MKLLDNNVVPVVVFDGKQILAKEKTKKKNEIFVINARI